MLSRDLFWRWYRTSCYGKRGGFSPRDFAKKVQFSGCVTDQEEKVGRPDACELDLEKVTGPIKNVWSQVYADMEHNAEYGGFHLTNLMAIEVCLDCDNIRTFAADYVRGKGKGSGSADIAEAEIELAIERFGYQSVLHFLARNIQLV